MYTKNLINCILKTKLILITFLFLSSISSSVQAQCSNFTISLTPTPSDCQSNGQIAVTISGPDAQNIRLSDAEYSIASVIPGGYSTSFATAPNGLLTNVPPGEYTVAMRAFCISSQIWVVERSTPTTIIGTYVLPSAYINTNNVRKSFACKPTGVIPVVIQNGKAPYTITITSAPSSYNGSKTFTVNSSGTYTIENAGAGTYALSVSDQCTYNIPLSVTIEQTSSDFPSSSNPFITNLYPVSGSCNDVLVYKTSLYNTDTDNMEYYWNNNASTYYEIAYTVDGTGSKNWETVGSTKTFTMPYNYNQIKSDSHYVGIYLRVKGATCESPVYKVTGKVPSSRINYSTSSICDSIFPASVYQWSDYDGFICYPYSWELRLGSTTGEVLASGNNVPNYSTYASVGNLKYNQTYYIICTDASGYTWTTYYNRSKSLPQITYTNSYCNTNFGTYIYMYNLHPKARIQFVSGPQSPSVTDYTMKSSDGSYYYPFGSNYQDLMNGTYKFLVTDSCGTQYDRQVTVSRYSYSDVTYTSEVTCDGLRVKPSGAIYSNGTALSSIYFRISSGPTGVSYNKNTIKAGGTLDFPESGRYTIQMQTDQYNTTCATNSVVIDYVKSKLGLDAAQTSAYVCQGETIGNMRVAANGGSGDYTYSLIDNNTVVETNTTGKFVYGSAGSTYTIKVADQTCNTSFEQAVTVLDLSNARIVYTDRADGKYCAGDSIGLNCITLGQTSYSWAGPNGFTSNAQNPVIYDATTVMGGIYTVSVSPESCGSVMTQDLEVVVNPLPVATFPNDLSICEDNPFTLSVSAPTATTYEWSKNGTLLSTTSSQYAVSNAALSDSGTYSIKVIDTNLCAVKDSSTVAVSPNKATWIASNNNSDWNDPLNWDRNVLPGPCTYVTIPAGKGYYPELETQSSTYAQAECDTIEFKYGGEVAKTNYLSYTAAKVNLDMGVDKWYLTSSPLQSMYSGDYWLKESTNRYNPAVYMMKYQSVNPQTNIVANAGEWSNPFNTMNVDLGLGAGYAVWIDGTNNSYTFDFPKSDMTYSYWNPDGTPSNLPPDQIPTRANSYRFVYETGNPSQAPVGGEFSVSIDIQDNGVDNTAILGNPYMSHLDFIELYNQNKDILASGDYQIWNGYSFDAVQTSTGISTHDELVRYIPQMQSVIVYGKATGIKNLKFSPAISVTAPNSYFRSGSDNTNNIIKMRVFRNGINESNTLIHYREGASNKYDEEDMYTFYSETAVKPAVIYSLVEGKSAIINTVGDLSTPVELGIRSQEKGELTIKVDDLGYFDSRFNPYLEDRLTGKKYNLRENDSYTFNNETGDVVSRFYLRFETGTTGIEDLEKSNISIYTDNQTLHISCSTDDVIRKVEVFTLQGQVLLSKSEINSSAATFTLPVKYQNLIVKVYTDKGFKTEKVMTK